MGDVQVAEATAPEVAGFTSRGARAIALTVYLTVLLAWIWKVGVPTDTLQIFVWIWAAAIAWNVQAPKRHHLGFVRDWWLPLVVLLVYLYSRGFADEIGLFSVHFTSPIAIDRWLFDGALPSQYLQDRWCGDTCNYYVPPRWYDVALTAVYYSHFLVAPTVAFVLWLRNRATWIHFMRRYLTINIVGLIGYITVPMAPPWMASDFGLIDGGVARLTGRGWSEIGLGGFHQALADVGNPTAAMPSLHAGIAALVAMYAVQRLRSPWRWLLLAYPLVMSLMLVYYGEHYVIDLIAGWLVAIAVLAGCSAWERLFGRQGTDQLQDAVPSQRLADADNRST